MATKWYQYQVQHQQRPIQEPVPMEYGEILAQPCVQVGEISNSQYLGVHFFCIHMTLFHVK